MRSSTARAAAVRTSLLALRADITALESELGALLADVHANCATLLSDVDTYAQRLVGRPQ